MKLTLAEPKYFKESISIISDLVTEATFKVNAEAIELVAMDPANVAMVVFKLFSSAFTEYVLDQPVEIAINLSNLKQIFRRIKPSDILTLEMSDANKLLVTLRGSNVRTFSLPIIELDEREQRVPELTFNSGLRLHSSILTDAIEDADIVGDSVLFQVSKEMFTVQAEGDLSHAKIEIQPGDSAAIEVVGDTQKAKYSIEYLKKMIVASKLADDVYINFSSDYPLKLDYKVVDKLLLSFILAPRVEND
ncbi:proliferating cell nuclear antigen (pcna) [Candidatus Woesearchaeota archaeon]|nr:proliferating cell nuclear antigen (pcna) [Candidatus Woesearchaeota archaeon]